MGESSSDCFVSSFFSLFFRKVGNSLFLEFVGIVVESFDRCMVAFVFDVVAVVGMIVLVEDVEFTFSSPVDRMFRFNVRKVVSELKKISL